MLEFLPSSDSVIAVRIRGKLERSGIEAFLDRLEAALAGRGRTHLFVEVEDFVGFETEGLSGHLGRVAKLLPHLDHLGRVAVVSDERWLRWAAKLESALLPKVSYETFLGHERDRALAWVEGETALPHGPAITIIETDNPDVSGFELDGKVGADEMRAATRHFSALLEQDRPLGVLGRIKSIRGFEIAAFADSDYFRMKQGMLRRVKRYAVVGGPDWLRSWVAFLDPLFDTEIRHFEPRDEQRAWEWLSASPTSERPLSLQGEPGRDQGPNS